MRRIAGLDVVPRILLRLLEAQRDALAVAVDVEDDDFQLLAALDDFARMLDAAPGEIGDVEQAVDAVEIDEDAEIGDVLDLALAALPGFERGQQRLALVGLLGFEQLAAREDDVAAVVGNLDELEALGLADEVVRVVHGAHVDVRAGEERLDSVHVHDQAAADAALDDAFDDAALAVALQDGFPADLVVRRLLRELDHAVVVLGLEHVDVDVGAFGDQRNVLELADGDHAFGLAADVHEDFGGPDFQDHALDDPAGFRLLEGCIQEFGHLQELRGIVRFFFLEHLGLGHFGG